jgi:Bacterial Ig domain
LLFPASLRRVRATGLLLAASAAIAVFPASASAAPVDCSGSNSYTEQTLKQTGMPTEVILDVLGTGWCDNTAVEENPELTNVGMVDPAKGTLRIIQSDDPLAMAYGHDVIGYTPQTGFVGRVPLQFTASNDDPSTSTATASIHVKNAEGDISCRLDSAVEQATEEDYEQGLGTSVSCYVDDNDFVEPGDANDLEITVTDVDGDLVTLADVEVSEDGGYYATVELKRNVTGDVAFGLEIDSASKGSDHIEARFNVAEVAPTNDAPFCGEGHMIDASHHHSHGATVALDLRNVCYDPEEGELDFAVEPGAELAHGTAGIAGGIATWTPAAGYRGYDRTTFTATDGTSTTSTPQVKFGLYERADLTVALTGPVTGTVGTPMSFTATAVNSAAFPSAETLSTSSLNLYLPMNAAPGATPAGCTLETEQGSGYTLKYFQCLFSNLAVGASASVNFSFTPALVSSPQQHQNVSAYGWAISGVDAEDTWDNDYVSKDLTTTAAPAVTPPAPPVAPPVKDTTPPVIDVKKVVVKPVAKLSTFLAQGLLTEVPTLAGDKVVETLQISAKDAAKLGLGAKKAKAKPVTIGNGSATAKVAGKLKVKVNLTAKAKKALKSQKKVKALKATLVIKVTDAAGNTTTKTKPVSIKLKK